jgi:hypothetical protein
MGEALIVRRGIPVEIPFQIDTGLVVLWYGIQVLVPEGWALSNGSNSTIDLRNRFIVGAGDEYNVAATGGVTDRVNPSHTHTLTIDNAGAHTHGFTFFKDGGSFTNIRTRGPNVAGSWGISTNGAHSHSFNLATQGNAAANTNLPPYMGLYYIQKIDFETEGDIIPSGIIIMWDQTEIPDGWLLCDGSSGTPNLRNRFVVGAGSTYNAEPTANVLTPPTGGNKDAALISHTHAVVTNTTGNHNHSVTRYNNDFGDLGPSTRGQTTPDGRQNTSGASGNHSHSLTASTDGESGTDQNMPPYYSLFYIMKGAE